jgi:cytochrome P450
MTNDFNPRAPETFTSAHTEYAELRRRCPVAHSEEFNGFWALFRYADVVAVMRQGAIEQCGMPRALLEAPANEFVRDFFQERLHDETNAISA